MYLYILLALAFAMLCALAVRRAVSLAVEERRAWARDQESEYWTRIAEETDTAVYPRRARRRYAAGAVGPGLFFGVVLGLTEAPHFRGHRLVAQLVVLGVDIGIFTVTLTAFLAWCSWRAVRQVERLFGEPKRLIDTRPVRARLRRWARLVLPLAMAAGVSIRFGISVSASTRTRSAVDRPGEIASMLARMTAAYRSAYVVSAYGLAGSAADVQPVFLPPYELVSRCRGWRRR